MPNSTRMIRRIWIALGVACALLTVASASATPRDDKLARLQDKIAQANKREGVLTSDIASLNDRIHSLQGDVSAAEARLAPLEAELAAHKQSLAAITTVWAVQSSRLAEVQRQYEIAEGRLARRLILIYQEEQPDTVAVLLSVTSISELVERLDYIQAVSLLDRKIAKMVNEQRLRLVAASKRTGEIRARVSVETRAVAARTADEARVRDRIVSTRDELATTRDKEHRTLDSVQESKQKWLAEVAAMQAGSADIAARIRAAGSSGAAPSSAGLIWPVSGTLTSPFGMRWGRMHEGIDIGAPEGTPIYAAAGGTVIYAGWEGGYGNLTVIDHGNGLSTAYGHQSQIAASNGQTVARGQVIGYVGNTGHSFGPHLHFEVRVNGTPVDPLQYL